ncbi:MAG TPA: CpaD family pilus assembly protein [Sphingomonadaceae bacterium]|nr:CpaD family pilus assembly protein [Sphingomonadaceae bacterium]
MTKPAFAAIVLGLSLAGCMGPTENRSLDSVRQPLVERSNFVLDLNTSSGGLPIPEQNRLEDWFETIDLGYGDRVSIDDPLSSVATRDAVSEIAGRFGILVSEVAPVTPGMLQPGTARIVVTRSSAHVPGCPDWEGKNAVNYSNATHDGFGCSVNGNLAAMVANPEDLIHGQTGTGETVIMTSTKAIETYRDQKPTGTGTLSSVSSASGAGGGGN